VWSLSPSCFISSTTLWAGCRSSGPAESIEDRGQLGRCLTPGPEDLSIPESDGAELLDDSGVEVPVEVAIAVPGRGVTETTVELHQEAPVLVVDIAPHGSARELRRGLAAAGWQSVRPLDESQAAVLERRAGALRHVAEDPLQPRATARPWTGLECRQQPRRGGPARAAGIGQCGDRFQVVRRGLGHVEDGVLVANARRTEVVLDALLRVGAPVQDDAGGRVQATMSVNQDMDGLVVLGGQIASTEGAHGTDAAQARRLRPQDCCPCSLQLKGPLCADVHPGVDVHQFASSNSPGELDRAHAEGEGLHASEDAGLPFQQGLPVVHCSSIKLRRPRVRPSFCGAVENIPPIRRFACARPFGCLA
jgi:hypothetical protein